MYVVPRKLLIAPDPSNIWLISSSFYPL